MALTKTKIDRLKPNKNCTPSKPNKYCDGNGLYLLVRHTGTKVFLSRYTLNGKRKDMTLGKYPSLSLKQARIKNHEIQTLAKGGNNPKTSKVNKIRFDDVANEWFNKVHKHRVKTRTYNTDYNQYLRDVKHLLGDYYLDDITPPLVLDVALSIEKRGVTSVSKKALSKINQIFIYAIERGYTDKNPSNNLTQSKSLVKHKTNHHSVIDVKDLPKLLQDINNYKGHKLVKLGLLFMAYTFLRTKNIRLLEWNEIDFDNAMLSIAGKKMKNGKVHNAPLSNQSIEILKEIKALNLSDKYVFFNRYKQQPYSDNAFLNALKNMGYAEVMTSHGFRTLASTVLNDYGFNKDIIETELSHSDKDKVRDTYNQAEYLTMRKDMVNKWALFLDNASKGNIESISPSIANINPLSVIDDLLTIYDKSTLIEMINKR